MKTITELVGAFVVSQREGSLDPKALPPDVSAGWWLHNHGVGALEAFDRQFPVWTPPTGSDVRKFIADALLLNAFRVILALTELDRVHILRGAGAHTQVAASRRSSPLLMDRGRSIRLSMLPPLGRVFPPGGRGRRFSIRHACRSRSRLRPTRAVARRGQKCSSRKRPPERRRRLRV